MGVREREVCALIQATQDTQNLRKVLVYIIAEGLPAAFVHRTQRDAQWARLNGLSVQMCLTESSLH